MQINISARNSGLTKFLDGYLYSDSSEKKLQPKCFVDCRKKKQLEEFEIYYSLPPVLATGQVWFHNTWTGTPTSNIMGIGLGLGIHQQVRFESKSDHIAFISSFMFSYELNMRFTYHNHLMLYRLQQELSLQINDFDFGPSHLERVSLIILSISSSSAHFNFHMLS